MQENRYAELKYKHQAEVEAFPTGICLVREQYEPMMTKFGLVPHKDDDKIAYLGLGVHIKKSDTEAWNEMKDRHKREIANAIESDWSGGGFIYEMFLYELRNHEFGYTGEPDGALQELGYCFEQIATNPRLWHGFCKAVEKIRSKGF